MPAYSVCNVNQRTVLRSITLGVVGALGLALVGCSDTLNDRDIVTAPLSEIRSLHAAKNSDAQFIDPRPASEFAQGRIPGSINLSLPRVLDTPDSLSPELGAPKTLVVYGNDPGSAVARAMSKRLMRAGAKDVRLFAGGIAEWTGAGLKLERDPGAVAAPANTPASAPNAAGAKSQDSLIPTTAPVQRVAPAPLK